MSVDRAEGVASPRANAPSAAQKALIATERPSPIALGTISRGDARSLLHLQRLAGNAAVCGALRDKTVARPSAFAGGRLVVQRDDKVAAEDCGRAPETARKSPYWLSPSYTGPLPGVRVMQSLRKGNVYLEKDRDSLKSTLDWTFDQNRRAIGKFLREFVDASVTIVAKYVMSSMKSEDKGVKFVKFVLAESLSTLAGGVAGLTARKALTFLASKATDFGIGELLENDDKFDDKKGLVRMIDAVGKEAGCFVESMILALGPAEADLNFWLGRAKPSDFDRFRVPERFDPPSRSVIRGTVAGAVAGNHHRRVIGGQMGSGLQFVEVNDVDKQYDNNVVVLDLVMHAGTPRAQSAKLRTRSKVLSQEIAGKAPLSQLPKIALHATLRKDPANALHAATEIMRAFRGSGMSEDDPYDFVLKYPKAPSTVAFTRNSKGTISILPPENFDPGSAGERKTADSAIGGHLEQDLLFYKWSTGDHTLTELSSEIGGTEEDEEGGQTVTLSARELAERTHRHFNYNKLMAVDGIRNLLSRGPVGAVVPQA